MVYCDYVSHTDSTVTYKYGGVVSDITGLFVFDFVNYTLEIIKEPEKGDAPNPHMQRMLRRHHEEFLKGQFKKKISYESH